MLDRRGWPGQVNSLLDIFKIILSPRKKSAGPRVKMVMRRSLGPEDGNEKSGTANRNYSKSKKNA